jgi:hypothetical protein
MSLWSALNANTNTSSSSFTYGTAKATSAIQALLTAQNSASKATSTNGSSSASISSAAKQAAAESTDNRLDFATLSKNVRATINAQYQASESNTADLSNFSGRALSAIILNSDSHFSAREVSLAKAELRTRESTTYKSITAGKSGLAALSAYNNSIVNRYDAISSEERKALGWTPATRANAVAFIQKAGVSA